MARPKSAQPEHRRQKTPGGNHRGFVVLSGERFYTGKWGTQEAEDQYLRHLAEWIARGRRPKSDPATTTPGNPPAALAAGLTPGVTGGTVDPISGVVLAADRTITVTTVTAQYWLWCKTRYAKWISPEGKITGELDNIRQALKYLNRLYGKHPAWQFGGPELPPDFPRLGTAAGPAAAGAAPLRCRLEAAADPAGRREPRQHGP